MKRPRLNIWLHLIVAIFFGVTAYDAGDCFFGGVMATLSLLILCDMYECIKTLRKEGK